MYCLVKNLFITCICLSFCFSTSAQDYSYVHYDVQNGLAGANVYAVYQDPQKFLWFGTETGVSRFDGTHFKNFTTNDGLPDNEILEIYGDEEGRVWFVPFKKTICYYYKGKIYNQQNDTTLKKIKLESNVLTVCTDKYKNTWILEEKGLYLMTPNRQVHFYDKINDNLLDVPVYIGLNKNRELILQWKKAVYVFNGTKFNWLFDIDYPKEYRSFLTIHISGDYIIWRSGANTTCAKSFVTGEMHCFEFPVNALRFSAPGDGTIAINTSTGSLLYNPKTKKIEHHFLKNVSTSKVLIDHEGGWWFTTLGEGVYQLLSTEYKNFVPWKEGSNQEIYSLAKIGNKLVMGTNFSQLLYTSDYKTTGSYFLPSSVKNKYNRITNLLKIKDGRLLCGSDEVLAVLDKNLKLVNYAPSNTIKSIFYKNDDSVYLATSNETKLLSLSTINESKILWKERSTAVCLYKNTLFVGTLNGLYHLPQGKLPVFMGEYDTLFTKRVSAMVVSEDTTLWVGTYDGGVIGLKKGMITDTFTVKQGLTSNICRNLFIDKNVLWVSTDKGVTSIDLNSKPYRLTPFTTNDGLLSNHINDVYKENDTVYVACQDGITYFDITKVSSSSQCNLEITGVYQSGIEMPLSDNYVFNHNQNNFRIEFVGISYKSTGDITYNYKLEGLNTAMKTTKETALDFLSLPSGKYELHIVAINKFGIKSELKKISITINPAFYATYWFYTLAFAATVIFTWLVIYLYNRNKAKREQQERATAKKISDLEQMALRAQMNPHFIFNCLNSIQQFVYEKDIQSANKFISGFAKLIRQTLDNSAKTTISIADETDYLNNYLSLEKIRFENKFDFEITVATSIIPEEYKIPVMLLQPYVENSIRHGIRYKKDGHGMIRVRFDLLDNYLVCTIEDNGIGRKKAMELKTRQHIEYQSKGMMLTGERIETINKILSDKIKMEIIDLHNEKGEETGTKILIYFPPGLV